ncbi:MAG: PH domain-containing protein [Cyanobacteria bacterium J06623_5]
MSSKKLQQLALFYFGTQMFFRSAICPWFYSLVVCFPIVAVGTVTPMLSEANSTAMILVAAVLLPIIILPTWLLFSTYYRVDSVILSIHAGPFSWSVPVEHIHEVTPCRSLSIAPALSMHRLKIDYGRQHSIYVSPKYRTAFLEALGYGVADINRLYISHRHTEPSARRLDHHQSSESVPVAPQKTFRL